MKTGKILTIASLFTVFALSASAETISLSGQVEASETHIIYTEIGGTIDSVNYSAGDRVEKGDVIASFETEKVYASADGTVTGVFGEAGDDAEKIADRYGAIVWMEEESVFQISASTDNAYNATANKFIHAGEEVLLVGYSDTTHTGKGYVTKVDGTSYTVRVTEGNFTISESVNIFRGSTSTTSRIGRGTISRISPTGYTASGSIVSFAVKAGDTVKKGDLLFETLSGSYDGYYMSGTDIISDVSGTISSISLEKGNNAQKGSAAVKVYPDGKMQIKASIEETYLSLVHVGDPVSIEMSWNQDTGKLYTGTIRSISYLAEQSGEDVAYSVIIDFTADEDTRYGMSCIVTTLESDEAETEIAVQPEEDVNEEAADQNE